MAWIAVKLLRIVAWAVIRWADRQGDEYLSDERADAWRDWLEAQAVELAARARRGKFKKIKSDDRVLAFGCRILKSNALARERERHGPG